MSDSAVIYLCSERETSLQNWSSILETTPARVVTGLEELPLGTLVDVVLTDRSPFRVDMLGFDLSPQELPGVVSIGTVGPAEVLLPSSATDREIQLSCLLLAQIAHLRREQRESQRIRHVLSRLALSDSLTGLPNRRAWETELSERISALKSGSCLLLVLMDLDELKQINDSRGHLAGDETLRSTAQALLAGLREGDFVARVGGDEYGILISGCEPSNVGEIVERIRRSVLATTSPPAVLSAGFAVARAPVHARQLYAAADAGLRAAKQAGGNCTVSGECLA